MQRECMRCHPKRCPLRPIRRYRASDKCLKEKRKTINGDDLLCAMSALGFEEYVEPLKLYLQKFREVDCPHLLTHLAFQMLSLPALVPRCPLAYFCCMRACAA
jgi:hypothetical protein